MNYETITFSQLNNRAPNAYREDIIPQSNEQKFAVCYLTETGKWWNVFETRDEQSAVAEVERMTKISPNGSRKIFLVVPEVQKSVVEEVAEVEATPETVEVVEQPSNTKRYLQFVSILPVNGEPHKVLFECAEEDAKQAFKEQFGLDEISIYADETLRIDGRAVRIRAVEKPVVEQSAEAVEASAEITVEPAHTVKVEADCRMGRDNHSRHHILYSGNDSAEARRIYQGYRSNPSHGTTWIAVFYLIEGAWTQSRQFSYDRADEYLKAWDAGAFNEAFKRDIANEEAVRKGGR